MTTWESLGHQYVSAMRNRDYASVIELRYKNEEEHIGYRNSAASRELSIALLRAGQVVDAIKHFERLIAAMRPDMRNDYDYCELGAAHWIAGESERAVESWQQALKCNYGDGAGNLTPALILYYAAVRSPNDALRVQAVSEIEAKLKTGWAKNWPAPLGRFLVGTATEKQVEADLLKEHPIRQPDQYCRFDFYRGVKMLDFGDEAAALVCFRSAVDRPEQKTDTTEFVLASAEYVRSRK